DRLRLAARLFQLIIATIIGHSRLGPEPPDQLARLTQPPDTLARRRQWDAVHLMFQLVPARADAEIEPSVRDMIERRADIRQDGGVTVGVAGHHQPNAQPLRPRGIGRQQRPALQTRASRIVAQWCKVIEKPGMFDDRDRIGLQPDAQHIVVGRMLRSRLHAEAQGCHLSDVLPLTTRKYAGGYRPYHAVWHNLSSL